jgi:hypothetical protein
VKQGADGRPPRRYAPLLVDAVGFVIAVLLLTWVWRADRHWFEVHTSQLFCFEKPVQIALVPYKRALGAILALVILLVLRPLAKRATRGRSDRDVALATGRICLAVALALVTCEIVLRIVRHPVPPKPYYGPMLEDDATCLFRPVRSHVTEYKIGEKEVRIAIDQNGYRVRGLDDLVDFSKPTVVFTGESIAEGFGLTYDETCATIVGSTLGVQVANVSVMGYGSDGAYLRLSEELPRFSKPIATVTLIPHVMIERNTFADRPHVVLSETGKRWVEPAREPKGYLGSPLLDLLHRLYQSDEALQRARAFIRASARESRERGAFPLFVLTNWEKPCLPDETGAPSIQRTLFGGLDVDFIRVDLGADTFDPTIDHPNAVAHEKLAAAIVRALQERVLPHPPSPPGGT